MRHLVFLKNPKENFFFPELYPKLTWQKVLFYYFCNWNFFLEKGKLLYKRGNYLKYFHWIRKENKEKNSVWKYVGSATSMSRAIIAVFKMMRSSNHVMLYNKRRIFSFFIELFLKFIATTANSFYSYKIQVY